MTSIDDVDPRPPLSAALLAQAVSVDPGRARVLCADGTSIEMDADEAGAPGPWAIVTWRGPDATHYKGTIANAPDEAHNQDAPV